MTKPTARLEWYPDPANPLAVRASWFGAGWHYRLQWGDGTSERVLFWQPPVRHAYPKPGAYTIVATSELDNRITVSVQIVLRDYQQPPVTAELVDPNHKRVRLTLPTVADPVRFEVNWGDGTVTEHGVADTEPEHEYPAHFTGKPTILVRDMPARRAASLVGPDIPGPEPITRGQWSFHPTFLPSGNPPDDERPTSIKGAFRGVGLTPNTDVTVRFHWSVYETDYAHTRTNDQGEATCVIPGDTGWTAPSAQWYYPHFSAKGYEADRRLSTFTQIPIITRESGWMDGPTWLYTFSDDDPWLISLAMISPAAGTYQVNWGDGTPTSEVECDGVVFTADHQFAHTVSRTTISVTGPDGRTTTRDLAAVDLYEPYISRNDDVLGVRVRTTIKHLQGAGVDCPVHIDWQHEFSDDKLPWEYRPASPVGMNALDHWYRNEWRGKQVTITTTAPLREPQVKTLTIPALRIRDVVQKDPPGVVEPPPPQPSPNPLTQTFHVNELKPAWYSAWFQITNNSRRAAPWQVEFTLPAPAVLKDVSSWRGNATKTDLGGGRWRITCDQPVPAQDSTRLDITVEPCGDPRIWPTGFTLTSPGTEGS